MQRILFVSLFYLLAGCDSKLENANDSKTTPFPVAARPTPTPDLAVIKAKAELETQQQALKLQAEEDAKPRVRIKGHVLSIIPAGILVECEQPGEGPVSYMQSIGGAGPRSIPDEDLHRPERAYGVFLLVKHPKQRTVVDDDLIDVDAIEVGVFSYTNSADEPKRVKRYKVVSTR